ncbi:tetratricopeptide repeat protein 1-like [Daphnia carinata]|uniref:tetratricopeptide repeat protein 1-like n=1 Tax=Daphnia carinata TaxID=120202 RepID=UPI00257B447C|nr:tetratricopeptide repeat protein 1-like [Daphnia carinata]
MAETNDKIIEDLTKDFETTSKKVITSKSEQEDQLEFEDALGPPSRKDSPNVSDESDSEDVAHNETLALSNEQIEERKREVLDVKEKGNEFFRNGNHDEACQQYSKALKLCPFSFKVERSILYNNRAAAKAKQGKTESALKDCTKAVDLNPVYIKALLRRAKLYEEVDQLDKALADYKELHKLEPNNVEVNSALAYLPRRIEEQTEKLKQEMFGKMKDLGNMFLKPFGLSTDNFQINKDPTTGSYSVNMNK